MQSSDAQNAMKVHDQESYDIQLKTAENMRDDYVKKAGVFFQAEDGIRDRFT